MEGNANIVRLSFNVAVPHSLPSLSLKLAPKLEPAQVALESLQQYFQDHIAYHTATIPNLFSDVKNKEVGIS